MKVQKRSATLAVACLFAGTCSAAIATGSQSALDPTLFVQTPKATPTITTNTAKHQIAAPQPVTNSVSTIFDANEAGSTVTQFVKVDGVAAEPVKADKKKTNQSGAIANVNDKVKNAGGGIVDGTKGTVVKGVKGAGEGIASVGGGLANGTKKVGDGIANSTKIMGGGLASGAKASGSFFLKGVHGMGSGLKAATSSIPGLGHGNKSQKPAEQSIAAKPAAVTAPSSPQTPQTATLPATNPKAAAPAVAPVTPAQLAAHALKPAKLPPVSQPKDLIVEHVAKPPAQKETPLWAPDKKVKPVVTADQQLPTEPGMIGKAFNKLTFWKHNPQVAASTKKNASPGPGM